MSPVLTSYHADDDPPLCLLGCERTPCPRPPGLTPFIAMLFAAALLSLVASALIGEPTPQELQPSDVDREFRDTTNSEDVPRYSQPF